MVLYAEEKYVMSKMMFSPKKKKRKISEQKGKYTHQIKELQKHFYQQIKLKNKK